MSLNPYVSLLGNLDPVDTIAATPDRITAFATSLTPDQAEASAASGKWSPREILCHLADCELAFGFRLRQAAAGQQTLQPFDQDAWARAYSSYTLEQAVQTFTTLRAWNLAFIRNLSAEDKARAAFHPERGQMTLWTIVETMAGHDLNHLSRLK